MFEVNEEFHVYRYENGIKLLKPQSLRESTGSVKILLQLPFPVYFSNVDHLSIKCNDLSAIECGYQSAKDIINKPWYHYFKRNTIAEPLANSNEIMLKNIAKITYENALRKDGSQNDALAIRMPWYNVDNKVIGLFGCAILPHQHYLAESLTKLATMGLLNFNQIRQSRELSGQTIASVHLSKRELECLKLTIRGYTAKSIAKTLHLSPWTIEEYLANIKRKYGVQSKSELIDKTIDNLFNRPNT